MSIRNFKPAIIGKDFVTGLKSQPSMLKIVEHISEQLFESKANDVIFKIFFAHFVKDGKPVEPNYTLGDLVALTDVGVVQEFMSDTRLREIMFGEYGLFKTYKLLMPIRVMRYYDEDHNDDGRHRGASFGFLGYSVAIALKRLGMPADEAVSLVDSQLVWVDRLDYDIKNSTNLTFSSTRKGKDTVYSLSVIEEDRDAEQTLLNSLTSQFVIQANSSRKPQKGEIEGVQLSSLGINIKKPASIINGFKRGAIDKFKLFRFLSQAELYELGNGYNLCLLNAFRYQQYKPYSPITLQKLFDGVAKSLWSHMGGGNDKCHPFRALMTGCENAMPKMGKDSWSTPAPKVAACNSTALLTFISALWEPQSLESWYETLEGYRFERLELMTNKLAEAAEANGEEFESPELSLVELAWQVYHTLDGADTVNLDKALTKSKDKLTYFTVFEGLLNQWDANLESADSNFYEYFEVFAEDEDYEDDEADEEELEEAESFMSENLFDDEL